MFRKLKISKGKLLDLKIFYCMKNLATRYVFSNGNLISYSAI